MLEEKIDALTASNAELVDVIKELIRELESGEITVKPPAKSPAKSPATQPAPEAKAKEEKAPPPNGNIRPLKKEEPKEQPETSVSKDDVKEALMNVIKEYDKEAMLEIISNAANGATTFAEVVEEYYQPIIDACALKLNELAEAA